MTQIIAILTTFFLGISVMAIESGQIARASVGQTFALKNDLIFDEGVLEIYLYSVEKTIYSLENKANVETQLYCKFTRFESKGGQCPGYPKAIVKADKFKIIRENSSTPHGRNGIINIMSSVKTGKCEFSYRFYCDSSYYEMDSASIKSVVEEINYQASRLVTIKDDPREPVQLP
jgi:hypothetical protein